ncbi:hypothetical protein NMY22_g18257 [Coprinellus aureogranulatus]|nr:hypothetical protein NMY22_g18257 [Coprinellus aureogranulatus]
MAFQSLTQYLPSPPQFFQSFFAGASYFTVSGGEFNAIAGNYVDNRTIVHGADDELKILLLQLQAERLARRGISERVAFTRENAVVFIDALGGEFTLPPSVIATYSDVHNTMVKHFRGKFGEVRVARQGYCLALERDGSVVRPEEWDAYKIIEKGEKLIMIMIIERAWVESVKGDCPRCGKTRLGTYKDDGWVICRRCNTRFTFTPTPDRMDKYPPFDDNNIESYKHMRKVFVQQVCAHFSLLIFVFSTRGSTLTAMQFSGKRRNREKSQDSKKSRRSHRSTVYSPCGRAGNSPPVIPHRHSTQLYDTMPFDFPNTLIQSLSAAYVAGRLDGTGVRLRLLLVRKGEHNDEGECHGEEAGWRRLDRSPWTPLNDAQMGGNPLKASDIKQPESKG